MYMLSFRTTSLHFKSRSVEIRIKAIRGVVCIRDLPNRLRPALLEANKQTPGTVDAFVVSICSRPRYSDNQDTI